MSQSEDGEAERQRETLTSLLEAARARSQTISFWWRDDDAVSVTPALEQLLSIARKHRVPLALAVIPKGATQSLAERLAGEPAVQVLQHGWQHKRHSPAGEKKMELGDHRPLPEVVHELRVGFERLTGLFPSRFLPVLVPPWNRISQAVAMERRSAGLLGLSKFGRRDPREPHQVNTHVDFFDWAARRPISRAQGYALLCRQVQDRLDGNAEPIGLLTHHLVHQDPSWEFLDELLALIRPHPAAAWPSVARLFDLQEAKLS